MIILFNFASTSGLQIRMSCDEIPPVLFNLVLDDVLPVMNGTDLKIVSDRVFRITASLVPAV